jgi:hypothetical protein
LALMCLPDVNTAIEYFLAGFQNLKFLPFIADAEAERLFGPAVTAALVDLDDYNRQKHICRQCQSHCCLLVRCELYDARFSGCAVVSLRPALCRLHFCDKFKADYEPLIKILGDIYLESLLAAAKIDSSLADMFDCPTFLPLAPHLVSLINPVLDMARSAQMTQENAFQEVKKIILINFAARTTA